MPSEPFSGPWKTTLPAFLRTISSMPAKYRASFNAVSNNSLATICSPTSLHIWETNSDIPSLLQLTQVIMKIKDMSTYIPSLTGGKNVAQGMVILVEHDDGKNNFRRVCELVEWLTDREGRKHLGGGVVAFGGIKVIDGMDNSLVPNAEGRYGPQADYLARTVVERVNKSIDRTLSASVSSSPRKLVWHQGPIIHFLNFWINNTSHSLRSSLCAISVHSAFALTSASISPSLTGRHNQPKDFIRLEKYCTKLSIFTVFTDCWSQGIVSDHLATYMYFYAYYVHSFLPASLLQPHLHSALDQFVLFSFQLYSACHRSYTSAVVKTIKFRLPASSAKAWARQSINPENYTKPLSRNAATDERIAKAFQLADSPFANFSDAVGLGAFSRLTLGPAASLISDHYICAPISLSLPSPSSPQIRVRAEHPSPFRFYLPKPEPAAEMLDADITASTKRIQGVMMAVLELVYRMKGNGQVLEIVEREKLVWDEVVKTCCWALENCKGKFPKGAGAAGSSPGGVEDKVDYVIKALKGGTWSWCLSLAGKGGQK